MTRRLPRFAERAEARDAALLAGVTPAQLQAIVLTVIRGKAD